MFEQLSRENLSQQADVSLNIPQAGHVLGYNAQLKVWQNQPLSALPEAPSITPEQFGAVGNGTTDDQTALQNWLNALGPNVIGTVTPNKTYYHSHMLSVTVDGTSIDGSFATFIGTTEQTPNDAWCALRIAADHVRLENVTLKARNVTKRYVTAQSSLLWFNECSNFIGRHIVSENSPSAGIISYGSHDILLEDTIVTDSWADGIRWSGGSYNIVTRRPVVRNPADDGVAVVSYYSNGNEPICHDIWVESPRIWGQNSNGRGVTVIGGRDITYTDIETYDTSGCGVYIATEFSSSSYYTQNVSNVRVLGGKIARANKNTLHDLGAIMLFTEKSNDVMSNVLVADVIVEDTRVTASGSVRAITHNGATLSNCALQRIMLRGEGPDTHLFTNFTPTNLTLTTDIDDSQRKPMSRLTTSDATTAATAAAFAPDLLFFPTTPGTYELMVTGYYRSSATGGGPRFSVAGNITPSSLLATLTQTTGATTVNSQDVAWAALGGVNPSAANIDYPFTFRAVIGAPAMGQGGTIGLTWASSSSSVTATLRAGTHATLTKIG